MSDEDIDLAQRDWMDIKAVLTHGVQLTIGEDGRTYTIFLAYLQLDGFT